MEEASLFSLPEGMRVEHIQITEHGLVIEVEASQPTSCCPLCTQPSDSIKTHYRRVLRDAPCAGRQVQLVLTARKFYCRNVYCPQKVFTERLPAFVEPWARMTIRGSQHITSIGLATCGRGGARLAARLGIQTTRPTILRRIMGLPDVSTGSVVYLGIDDFAFRRGYRFGTILVNLESHRVVDLLPDRRAETAARWMYQQPDLAVISRDRGGEYASAAREGAPQAIECADRFHIVKNLTEAFQVLLAHCQAEILAETKSGEPALGEQNKPIISIEEWRPPEPAHVEKTRLARRASRYARYQQVVELSHQGLETKEIAGRVGLSDRTIRDWLKQGTFPEAQKRRKKQSPFDSFAASVLKRWQDGEHNGLVLWQEIKKQGYTGTDRSVYRYLKTLKQAEVRATLNPERIQKYAATAAIWLFVRDPKKLDEIEREDLAAFCQASAPLKKAYDLLQDFLSMVHQREGQRLDAWLARVAESGLPELQSFAAGVEKDKDAVKAGLTWPINNGMVARPCHEVKTHQANDVWQSWLCPAPSTCAPCSVVFSPTLSCSFRRLHPLGKRSCSFVTIGSRLCSRTGFNHLFALNETGVPMSYHHCKLIASGVARLHGNLLLVQQSYPGDPHPYWGLPGGQVEPGEALLAGLQRELLEETGLTLVGTPTIAFVLQVLRKTQESIQEWLVCHFACEVAGQINPQDPDGLILSAHWVEEPTALDHLGMDPGYDCEPLRLWLRGEAAPGTVYTVEVK